MSDLQPGPVPHDVARLARAVVAEWIADPGKRRIEEFVAAAIMKDRRARIRMIGLTQRQRDVLGIIESALASTGVSPSYDEIAIRLGIASRSGVFRIVHSLADRGAIRISRPGGARSISLAA